jgi:hypothetical protein
MQADRGAGWAWALTMIGLVLSLGSLTSGPLRVLLLCLGAAVMTQALPVWVVGRRLAARRRREALELIGRVGGRITDRLAADPRQILGVDLSGCPVGNDECDTLTALPALERLSLADTRVDGEGVEHLAALEHLEFLDLSQTRLGDAGLNHLHHFPTLAVFVLDGSLVTAEGVESLRWADPHLAVFAAGIDADHTEDRTEDGEVAPAPHAMRNPR